MGGHKRKLAAEQRERILQAQSIAGDRLNDDGSVASSVCELLILLWCWGMMPATLVQRVAHKVYDDFELLNRCNKSLVECDVEFFQFGMLRKLAKLGDWGAYPGNCNRDLINTLPVTHLNIDWKITLPLKIGNAIKMTVQGILWPHQLFASMYHYYPKAWIARVRGAEGELRRFWTQTEGHPVRDTDDLRERGDLYERCVPLTLHGDATPITGLAKSWAKMMDCFTWSSMVGKGATMQCAFFIYAVFHKVIAPDCNNGTYNWFAKRLKWSLFWLWLGRWPTHDPDGVEYAEVGNVRSVCVLAKDRSHKHTARTYGRVLCFFASNTWGRHIVNEQGNSRALSSISCYLSGGRFLCLGVCLLGRFRPFFCIFWDSEAF